MRIVIGNLLFALAVFLNSIELGLSSSYEEGVVRSTESVSASYYGDGYGHLIPLIAGSFHPVSFDALYIVGIHIGENIHPIYDSNRRQILIRHQGNYQVVMDQELRDKYNHVFVNFLSPTRSSTSTLSSSPTSSRTSTSSSSSASPNSPRSSSLPTPSSSPRSSNSPMSSRSPTSSTSSTYWPVYLPRRSYHASSNPRPTQRRRLNSV